MEDDLIDDSGFELGMPSHVDMLKHYCCVLEAELDTTRRDLRRAHQNIAGLIVMHRDTAKELAALKVDHQRITQRLSQFYEADRAQEVARMGYAYGNYEQKP
ncbi:MAG: hypothetical protein KJ643_15250 [Gammaproteobacteria bacterium]|uniref:hypothetical protein n=1 Tax=Pseudomonas mandelii TaxID=75612 RepID=UPI0012B339F9|nr:hypothetical protein [Pseudomonas mandelii]MBU0523589.1 hypothetical protein [Gammaproteobacteria bacterium]MBU0844625.1 hypothetical protein [Gammaproteobacteria bacterium]MBU1843678.1 hypothetical protein [Gammaproteobacteria bacterium]MSU92840.1 hypothetical protein [Pseudomonas mandelii]